MLSHLVFLCHIPTRELCCSDWKSTWSDNLLNLFVTFFATKIGCWACITTKLMFDYDIFYVQNIAINNKYEIFLPLSCWTSRYENNFINSRKKYKIFRYSKKAEDRRLTNISQKIHKRQRQLYQTMTRTILGKWIYLIFINYLLFIWLWEYNVLTTTF